MWLLRTVAEIAIDKKIQAMRIEARCAYDQHHNNQDE